MQNFVIVLASFRLFWIHENKLHKKYDQRMSKPLCINNHKGALIYDFSIFGREEKSCFRAVLKVLKNTTNIIENETFIYDFSNFGS